MMDSLAIHILYKLNSKMKKENVGNSAETVTVVGTGR